MNDIALTAQDSKALEVQQNKERMTKDIQALIAAVLVSKPEIKENLTVPAVWQFMQLPDTSYGWVPPGKDKENVPMPFAAKAMCILTALRVGLIPGNGMMYWLGNQVYIAVAGLRHIANTSKEFKWTGPLKPRPLTEDEKLMLDIGPKDRGLAVERDLEVRGQKMTAIGYGILDEKDLSLTQSGYARPGRDGKKNIFQTLVTRAEKDIFKHYLPLEVPAEPDWIEREKMKIVDVGNDNKGHDANKIMAAQAGYQSDEAMRALAENLKKAQERFDNRATEVAGLGGNALDILKVTGETLNQWRADQLNAACEVLMDWAEKKSKEREFKTDTGAVEAPVPKAYAMIEKVLAEPELDAFTRDLLQRLKTLPLKDVDHLELPKAIRESRGGSPKGLEEFVIDRQAETV
jgi:hypothetical protein